MCKQYKVEYIELDLDVNTCINQVSKVSIANVTYLIYTYPIYNTLLSLRTNRGLCKVPIVIFICWK